MCTHFSTNKGNLYAIDVSNTAKEHVAVAFLSPFSSSYFKTKFAKPSTPIVSNMGLQYGPGNPFKQSNRNPTSSVITKSMSIVNAPVYFTLSYALTHFCMAICRSFPCTSVGSGSACINRISTTPSFSTTQLFTIMLASANFPAFPVQYNMCTGRRLAVRL